MKLLAEQRSFDGLKEQKKHEMVETGRNNLDIHEAHQTTQHMRQMMSPT